MVAAQGTEPEAHYAIPDAKTLQQAGELSVLDEGGKEISFKSLYTGDNAAERELIVFIRHFRCGYCEAYVSSLATSLPRDKLMALSPPTHLTIIGCGEPQVLRDYIKRVGREHPIYCDPSRKLYSKLGMEENLTLGETQPDYMKTPWVLSALTGAVRVLSSGANMFKGGDFSQNGGEWIFQHGEVTWCRRMRNTRDHAEIAELKEVLKME